MTSTRPFLAKPGLYPRNALVLPPTVLAPTPDAAGAAHRYVGQRVRWYGRVTAVIAVPPTLYLGDVRDDNGVIVWESVWLHHTPYLRGLDLAEGNEIGFVARVDKLLDGSYVLNRPLKVQRVAVSAEKKAASRMDGVGVDIQDGYDLSHTIAREVVTPCLSCSSPQSIIHRRRQSSPTNCAWPSP